MTCSGYDRDRSDQISRVIKLENGTLTITDYTSFLETSVFVTGAILASTGSCSLYNHLFNVSIQPTENEGTLRMHNIIIVIGKLKDRASVMSNSIHV